MKKGMDPDRPTTTSRTTDLLLGVGVGELQSPQYRYYYYKYGGFYACPAEYGAQ